MASLINVECLGCRRPLRMPKAIAKMAERYDEDRFVIFCSRKCNESFVRREAKKLRNTRIEEMIDRAERKSDAIDSDPV